MAIASWARAWCRKGSRILEKAPIDLIVVDMLLRDGNGMNSAAACAASRRTELIPVLMVCRAATWNMKSQESARARMDS